MHVLIRNDQYFSGFPSTSSLPTTSKSMSTLNSTDNDTFLFVSSDVDFTFTGIFRLIISFSNHSSPHWNATSINSMRRALPNASICWINREISSVPTMPFRGDGTSQIELRDIRSVRIEFNSEKGECKEDGNGESDTRL
ncbi:hypothetical protein PMAYCL1PPCAC_20233 [Pristionchus mayeri]|uniref:Uncharacterized protein n=1 Tax=Pristionchus mayeri TaxID=1317129 RepID=A0AAN5I2Y7_9BILA|nr:hypothetical protein PMAYCL1PPCAC_20233 [Pristionchus mayeri]